MQTQVSSEILMIRPVAFAYNEQTAVNNAFQEKADSTATAQEKAISEFDNMVELLRAEDVNVRVVEDTAQPHTPDSIFPNNWVSFHERGLVVLYPMFAPNRRLERQKGILKRLEEDFLIEKVLDLSYYESKKLFLEGTGSMVLDRQHKVAFAAFSPRTHQEVLKAFSEKTGYEVVSFSSFDQNKEAVYHTNVMFTLCRSFAIVCLESITNEQEREIVKTKLEALGKEVISISFEQMRNFAGNMLELYSKESKNLLVMSSTAYASLEKSQIKTIEQYTKIIIPHIPTIEQNGGGGVRCMIAELFLPKK